MSDSRRRTADGGRLLAAVGVALLLAAPVSAQTFYPDDPLTAEPPPFPVVDPQARALSDILELVGNTVGSPGERHPESGVIPAGAVNTLGDVLDGPWFINRHATKRLTRAELARGPGDDQAPTEIDRWQVLSVRPFGSRPGMLIADAQHRLYLLFFDAPGSLEMSTGAQMVSSRIAHAIGYNVPETYIVRFPREQLVLAEGAEIVSSAGNTRALSEIDVEAFLRGVARTELGLYRAVALLVTQPEWAGLLGPYQVFATRSDDPNDVVAHEHRRDLRGMFVISSWINHSTMRAVATHDVLVDNGVAPPHIRHYLVDLWSTLGSGLFGPKRAWEGNDRLFNPDASLRNILGFGVWSPEWMGADYPRIPAVGRFESATFNPERWESTERLATFENRLPDDEYWGAKQIMAFSDDDIQTVVSAGEYTDPEAVEWITQTLIARREKIGRYYFAQVLPLDNFRVEGGRVAYEDLAERYGVTVVPRTYTARWLRFVNETGALLRMPGHESFEVPAEVDAEDPGRYYGVRIEADGEDTERNILVFLRTETGGRHAVVGIERGWPGKVIADPRRDEPNVARFASLEPELQQLYAPYAERDAEARGLTMTVEEHFDDQTVSERTTYDGVTHALLNSQLSDDEGNDLGTAFDLVTALELVLGQYHGRGGDQQFRLFVDLRPDAVETLERSTEFFRDRDNTVFHVGFPQNFRQTDGAPKIQFSVSEDGLRADIDVDYRSSSMPASMFNGHLTAANSDVRANFETHSGRWAGLIEWWTGVFGDLPEGQEGPRDILGDVSTLVPTPLPPNRPPGAQIERPEDAVQEFLTDWLVRRDLDEAMTFVSSRAYACVNTDDDSKNETLDAGAARAVLRDTMEYVIDEMGELQHLTEAVERVPPFDPDRELIEHAFDREFVLADLSAAEASQYLCGQEQGQVAAGSYRGTLFRFRRRDGGALGLLWAREDGQWKLVSYQVFDM